MRKETIGLNYAEALFAVGEQRGETLRYLDLLDTLAGTVETQPAVAFLLSSPRVPKATKLQVIGTALEGAPRPFALFVQGVVRRGRQGLLREIVRGLEQLVDAKLGRVRASVVTARPADEALKAAIVQRLGAATGKDVLATYRVDREILGGVIVRVGDRVHDGSVRRRLARLRRQLLAG